MATDDTAAEPAASHPGLLPSLAREVEEYVADGGWDQPARLFALVATETLLAQQPDLAASLDVTNPLTPVAQESLPATDLAEALAGIEWPETVSGCALAQEIVVLPPGTESELEDDRAGSATANSEPAGEGPADSAPADSERMRAIAAEHPDRREARLVAAVLRDGSCACVLRLRHHGGADDDDSASPEQRVEHPELAPNLTRALLATLNE